MKQHKQHLKYLSALLSCLTLLLLAGCGDLNSNPANSSTGVAAVQKSIYSTTSQEQVQKAFIAYYGRPADPSGLAYWAAQLDSAGGNWSAVIESFGNSAEATALLSGLSNEQKIDKLYTQMFGRSADAEGRAFYAAGLADGRFTLASLAVNIINGAQGSDATTVANKLATSQLFTASLNSSNTALYNENSVTAVRNFLAGITTSTATQASVNTALSTMVAAGIDSINLTTNFAGVYTGTYSSQQSTGPWTFTVDASGKVTGYDGNNWTISGTVNTQTGAFTATVQGSSIIYLTGTINPSTGAVAGTFSSDGQTYTGTSSGSRAASITTAMLSNFFGKTLTWSYSNSSTGTAVINADGTLTTANTGRSPVSGTWTINSLGQMVTTIVTATNTETTTFTLISATATSFTGTQTWMNSSNSNSGSGTMTLTLAN